MKYLAIDWGKIKIGLATGSDETKIASPLSILSPKVFWEKVETIIKDESIDSIVLGNPLKLNGGEAEIEEFVKFKKRLEKLSLPYSLEDERMSTKAAGNVYKELGIKNRGDDDDLAATQILQTFLDRI